MTDGNAGGNAGPLFSPACPGYRDYNVGGKPPPPTVPPVKHAGALTGDEWVESHHCSVLQGGGEKETMNGGRGAAGEWVEGLSGLRQTSRDGYLFQIHGAGLDGSGRQLVSGSGEPE